MKKLLFLICLWYQAQSFAQPLQQDLGLPYLVSAPAHAAGTAPLVLLLHGYGSNEADLFDLKDLFPAGTVVVAVRAPIATGNGGYQWYPMKMVQGKRDADPKDLAAVTERLRILITALQQKYKTAPARTYVMGFSQGGIMSYQLGLHHPELVSGIGIWSGRLLPASQQQISKHPALKKLNVFIAHGTADPVIPFSDATAARDFLLRNGITAGFHSYTGMQHQIGEQELKDIRKWAGTL